MSVLSFALLILLRRGYACCTLAKSFLDFSVWPLWFV